MTRTLALSLITLGNPGKLTGGYLYHRRMADAASRHGARLAFASVPERPFPLPMAAGDAVLSRVLAGDPAAVLVDSIAAAYLVPAILRRPAPVPLCAVLHQPPGGIDHGPLRTRLQAMLDMLLYQRAARLIVASAMLADEMGSRGIPTARLRVVPPGRDLPADAPEPSFAGDLRRGTSAAFLCVANWLARKGIHTLLDAFALLPPPKGVLHLVGDHRIDPAYSRRIAKRLARPDLGGRVFVHGPLPAPAVLAFYRSADVFVLPSTKEPYGTVYGEAMSAGLPIVGLRAGNLPYLVTAGIEGLLVAPGDVRGLAVALLSLAGDERLRTRLGEAARLRAVAWPTWEETAAAFFAAVREVAGS